MSTGHVETTCPVDCGPELSAALTDFIHLVDTAAKTARSWTAKPPIAASQIYHDCAAPPAPDKFRAHGLNIRQQGQGQETLYVVNHGGRETIDVLSIDSKDA